MSPKVVVELGQIRVRPEAFVSFRCRMEALEDSEIYLALALLEVVNNELTAMRDRNLTLLAAGVTVLALCVVELVAWEHFDVPIGLDLRVLFSEVSNSLSGQSFCLMGEI